ncbi:MAG: segregation/condensation protein A [Candidatus Poribacteria bacterium]|nr:segregation/condensation protein A [Candidatus Poribacteria bacterium]
MQTTSHSPLPASAQSLKPIYAIKLDAFEGPLDLLLHLIQKNEMEITDIPIAEITEQYLEYLNFMELLDLDVASEFLVMAATLLHLKSQSILPSAILDEPHTFKDREQLVRQLLEYKQFKAAAQALDFYAARREQIYGRTVNPNEVAGEFRDVQIKATLFDLLSAFKLVNERQAFLDDDYYEEIREEQITVEEKMEFLKRRLSNGEQVRFDELFSEFASKIERIVTFLAVLELARLQQIVAVQSGHFGDIYIVKREIESA